MAFQELIVFPKNRGYSGCSLRSQTDLVLTSTHPTEGLCCKECGLLAVYQACHAVKVWEFPNDDKGYVYVYRTGTHSCSASNKPRIPAHKLQELIHHNPNVKPQQAANQIIMNAIRDDASREELDELKEKLQGNPCGKRVDHLIKLKQ